DLCGFGFLLIPGSSLRRYAPVAGTCLSFVAALLVAGCRSGSGLDRLSRATQIFVLLVQRLKQGFGRCKNRLIFRKCGSKGCTRPFARFGGNFDSGLGMLRFRHSRLLIALVLGNRLTW